MAKNDSGQQSKSDTILEPTLDTRSLFTRYKPIYDNMFDDLLAKLDELTKN